MKTIRILLCTTVALLGAGLVTATWAVDLGGMKQKVETVKGQAENVKKEGGETAQSAKDMKAKDVTKNAGEMKDEGKNSKMRRWVNRLEIDSFLSRAARL